MSDLTRDFNRALVNNKNFSDLVKEMEAKPPTYVKVEKQVENRRVSNNNNSKLLRNISIGIIVLLVSLGIIKYQSEIQDKWMEYINDNNETYLEEVVKSTEGMTADEQSVYYNAYYQDLENRGIIR